MRLKTEVDTEAKLFEFFAELYEKKKYSSITMISERGMCDSCRDVMKQFKENYPGIKVNVVSNKIVEGDVWRNRRRKHEV